MVFESKAVLVSIIVGIKDRIQLLPQLINSLQKQSLESWELIIVDQSQTASMAQSVPRDPRIVFIASDPGLSKARNAGLKVVQGDFVSFLDDDCWLPTYSLQNAVEFLTREPKAAGLVGRVCTEDNKILREVTVSPVGPLSKLQLLCNTLSVGIVLRKKTLDSLEIEFDEGLGLGANSIYQSGEEADLLLRLEAKGGVVFQVDDFKVFHPHDFRPASRLRRGIEGLTLGYLMRRHRFSLGYLLLRSLMSLALMSYLMVLGRWTSAMDRWVFCTQRLRGYWSEKS